MLNKISKFIFLLLVLVLPATSFATGVNTLPATHISFQNAKVWGQVQGSASANNLNLRFRYSTNAGSSCKSMPGYTEVAGIDISSAYFYQDLEGLSTGTTYYFCAIAWYQDNPKVYGNVLSFKTLGTAAPTGGGGSGNVVPGTVTLVTTGNATGVTDIQATLHGNASGVTPTVYGYFRLAASKIPPIFCNDIYGSNMRAVPSTSPFGSSAVLNGEFSAVVDNLEQNTTYYYCAFASNAALNSPGSLNALNRTIIKSGRVHSFHTLPCQTCDQTTVDTTPALVTGPSTATLRGKYGSSKAVTTYFEYRATNILEDWHKTPEEQHEPNSYRSISAAIRGLKANTPYAFRAVAQTNDPVATIYGPKLDFITRTADGFGDGEGWIYDGEDPNETGGGGTTVIGNGPGDPTQNCAQDPNPDAPNQGCNDQCDEATEDCDNWNVIYDDCNPILEDCDQTNVIDYGDYQGGGYGGGYNGGFGGGYGGGYGGGGYNPYGSGTTDFDGDGINNFNDLDLDGDGSSNVGDNDTDGDGLSNSVDTDDDNDGIPDASDSTPLGNGSSSNDLDGDGLSNSVDTDDDGDGIPDVNDNTPFGTSTNPNDLDGDGISNALDTDMDGDGIPNNIDPDDDNDGLPDHLDRSSGGNNGNQGNQDNNQGGEPKVGDETTPPQDAIVRYHEGVETVFIRQIMGNVTLAKKYGYRDGEDLQKFSWYLAHFLGKSYGYVAKNKKEVRVRYPDVAAYELKEVGGTTTVYESFENSSTKKFHITGIRKLNSLFKMIFKYEYYFLKRR